MNIAIVDADLLGRKKHNFPNLVCLKLSGYHKAKGDNVSLQLALSELDRYDKLYVSKVFTDTPFDESILKLPNVEYGGTGFYFDKAPALPYDTEHTMPDYTLYDDFVESMRAKGLKVSNEYTNYSIGYLTRGCFRKCPFCVNQKYSKVFQASPLAEFYDPSRKKICLLDDNFLGYPGWRELLEELIDTGKPFKFKQGLDERILTDEKCKLLFSAKYDGEITLAFDNVNDYDLIKSKLELIRKYSNKPLTFYVLCGFDYANRYDSDFWINDLYSIFRRIELLTKYNCFPYLMRFNAYENSPIRGTYITLARWINQRAMFKKKSFMGFIEGSSTKEQAPHRYLRELLELYPQFDKTLLEKRWCLDD